MFVSLLLPPPLWAWTRQAVKVRLFGRETYCLLVQSGEACLINSLFVLLLSFFLFLRWGGRGAGEGEGEGGGTISVRVHSYFT